MNSQQEAIVPSTTHGPLRIGIGGPVGSGKTSLVESLCKGMRDTYDIIVITNDIYTKEDQMMTKDEGLVIRVVPFQLEFFGLEYLAVLDVSIKENSMQ